MSQASSEKSLLKKYENKNKANKIKGALVVGHTEEAGTESEAGFPPARHLSLRSTRIIRGPCVLF